MNNNYIVVMGYPNKPNKDRFNSNRNLSNGVNPKKGK
jgi:hypothetical protein